MNTGKFKLGDKVRLIERSSYRERTKDTLGEIVAVRGLGDYVVFFGECEEDSFHRAEIGNNYLVSYSKKHYKKTGNMFSLKEKKGLYLSDFDLVFVSSKKGNINIFKEVE